MYTDVSVGLPAGQPRGIPISNPPLRAGGCGRGRGIWLGFSRFLPSVCCAQDGPGLFLSFAFSGRIQHCY